MNKAKRMGMQSNPVRRRDVPKVRGPAAPCAGMSR